MNQLTQKRCIPCEGGTPPLTETEIKKYLNQVVDWEVVNDKRLIKKLSFTNFHETMAFVNAVAWVAHQENHHPDMKVGYNYCHLEYSTHSIDGLSENDFICAAKVDALFG
jgi:4a-hydroxytetrahydrobiopterin dehydratase